MSSVVKEAVKGFEGLELADVLRVLGLQRKQRGAAQAFAVIGLIGTGAIIGSIAMLLVPPRTTEDLRHWVGQGFESLKKMLPQAEQSQATARVS